MGEARFEMEYLLGHVSGITDVHHHIWLLGVYWRSSSGSHAIT